MCVQKHPKNASLGTKNVPTSSKIYIELQDAEQLQEGENATFINWGNLKIKKINRYYLINLNNDKIILAQEEW